MLLNIKQLYGRKLVATDGDIGEVRDLYFDDKTWAIRYLVVDTGPWLTGREVLLSPHAFVDQVLGSGDADAQTLQVNLSKKKIEASPSIESHRPVSRQYEEEYYYYYGWPTYWSDFGMGSIPVPAGFKPPSTPEVHSHHGHNQRDDLHLRSTKAMTGYHIHATDGEIGSVSSFMMDRTAWSIRELVVETGHWYAGKPILILPADVARISYEESSVFVNLTKETIARTTKDEVAHAAAGPR